MRLATLRTGAGTAAARQVGDTYNEILGFADVGELLLAADWRVQAAAASGVGHDVERADLAPVIPTPGKIVCVGLNYKTHIREMGRDLPEYPTLFSKYSQTLIGPTDDIELPGEDTATDWEAELAVIMGKAGRRIPAEEAGNHIAGYSLCKGISMRTWQFRTKEWLQGKDWERSTPLGPVLVSKDEWGPGARIRTVVDGVTMQEASTDDLVHGPEFLISYISTMITLNPGDVIITGTPGALGHARNPRHYLAPGQLLEASIDGIGVLLNRVVASVAA